MLSRLKFQTTNFKYAKQTFFLKMPVLDFLGFEVAAVVIQGFHRAV